jgi:DNA-binding transcriptional LysR family regulator
MASSSHDDDLDYRLVLEEPVYLIKPAADAGAPAPPETAAPPEKVAAAETTAPPETAAAAANMLAAHADHRWIAGCERCRNVLMRLCRSAGFTPDIAVTTDDTAAAQALVAAGLGVTLLPGLALRAFRHPGVTATELPGIRRQVFAIAYGGSSQPTATTALLEALTSTAARFQ